MSNFLIIEDNVFDGQVCNNFFIFSKYEINILKKMRIIKTTDALDT